MTIGTDYLAMNRERLVEKLAAKNRKIKENRGYRRWDNHKLYTRVEKITDTVRKDMIAFCG